MPSTQPRYCSGLAGNTGMYRNSCCNRSKVLSLPFPAGSEAIDAPLLEALGCVRQTWAWVLGTISIAMVEVYPTRTIMAPKYRLSFLLLVWEESSKLWDQEMGAHSAVSAA